MWVLKGKVFGLKENMTKTTGLLIQKRALLELTVKVGVMSLPGP